MKSIQMWAGFECTLNRIGDQQIDQCEKNGHYHRPGDLALFHNLGIQKLRYPCLWEKVAARDLDHCDWTYLDECLNELKRLGQDFIAEFLHHGSGPLYTSLIDPDFPEKFSTYARLFIHRYPWVNDFTPISDINLTAGKSLLDGYWYPHLKDKTMYFKALLIQCKATVLAMKEIRRVNPKARLIQTDDTRNDRSSESGSEIQWLAWDILCGKLTSDHPLYSNIIGSRILAEEISWFEENSCPPNIIGISHATDPKITLKKAWERYRIPLAVTEWHSYGSRRESQMRRLSQIWSACHELQNEGVEIEAVTASNLLGTFDRHNLYEPGVFHLKCLSQLPHKTALVKMVYELATKGTFESPILFCTKSRPILITDSGGQLGQSFSKVCDERKIYYEVIDNYSWDLRNFKNLERLKEKFQPWAIINTNELEAIQLAKFCQLNNINLLHITSDYEQTMLSLKSKNKETAPKDIFISPTFVDDLVNECLDLLIDGEKGIIPLDRVGEMSWVENLSKYVLEHQIPREQEIHP